MISYRLKEQMEKKGVTYRQVSKEANIAVSTLQKVANNENVQTDIIDRLCRYFDCDISELVIFEKGNGANPQKGMA